MLTAGGVSALVPVTAWYGPSWMLVIEVGACSPVPERFQLAGFSLGFAVLAAVVCCAHTDSGGFFPVSGVFPSGGDL